MTVTNSRLRAFTGWHLPAVAFFALGLLAGIGFAVTGPAVAIRALGGVAVASALLGMGTVLYSAHFENPLLFNTWHAAAGSLHVAIRATQRDWAERVRHVDRYLQNAVWSALG